MDIKHLTKSNYLFALFIGRSNGGKSCAAASLPKPMQELDFDLRANGILNAVEQGWLDIKLGELDIKQFDPFKGFLQVQDHLNLMYTFSCTNQMPYKSIDIGSLKSLLRLLELTSLTAPAKDLKHLVLQGLAMTGPADYKFESQSLQKIIDFLRVLPCNITISAHIIDKWGKRPSAGDYDERVIIGEKLTITENLGEHVLAMFNDVFKFSKQMEGGLDKYYVEFNSEIARNTYGIPPGRFDITGRPFWEAFQEIKAGKFEKPKPQRSEIFTL